LKIALNIFLALVFLYQTLVTSVIYLSFEINRAEIAKTLCEKKDEPGNCCKGSCHLKKQLQEEEKKEQLPNSKLKGLKQVEIFCQTKSIFFNSPHNSSSNFVALQIIAYSNHLDSVFHPPCIISC